MILCIGTTPAAQRVMVFKRLSLDSVNRAAATVDGIAGKSINVAKVFKALGARPVAMGFLGGPRGEEIKNSLAARQIEADFIKVASPTRQCITVIDQSNGTMTELVEESQAVAAADFERLTNALENRIGNCRAVLMSGTIAPGGPVGLYRRWTELARRSGALAIVDAQGPALDETLAAQPDLVKPNRQELARTLGRELPTEADLIAAMRELLKRGARRVVVTAGRETVLAADGHFLWHVHPPRIAPINSIGSGDAFTAGLVWRWLEGDNLGEACRWGAAAGAANALSLMPGELEFADVERLARQVAVETLAPQEKPCAGTDKN